MCRIYEWQEHRKKIIIVYMQDMKEVFPSIRYVSSYNDDAGMDMRR